MQYQYAPMGAPQMNPGGFASMPVQGFAARGQPFAPAAGYAVQAPTVTAAPLTPKIQSGNIASMTSQPGIMGTQNRIAGQFVTAGTQDIYAGNNTAQPTLIRGGREQALEQRVRELESLLQQKEKTIQELQGELASVKGNSNQKGGNSKIRSPGRTGSGFRKVAESKPVIRYSATDQDDPIDVRLEEFYNSTGSAIQFRRINRGFYRFGDTIVELDIINHKLMARTEDGWNRGKFGPIEKFLMYYENIEREKAGILPES